MEQRPEQRSMTAHRSFLGDAGHFISSFRAIYLNNPDGRAFAFSAHRYMWPTRWEGDGRVFVLGPGRQGGRKRGDQGRGGERRHRGSGRSVGGLHGPRRRFGVSPHLVRVQPRADGARLRRLGGAAGAAGDLRHAHRHGAAAVVLLRPGRSERVRDRQPARVGAPPGLRPRGLLAPGTAGRGPFRQPAPGVGVVVRRPLQHDAWLGPRRRDAGPARHAHRDRPREHGPLLVDLAVRRGRPLLQPAAGAAQRGAAVPVADAGAVVQPADRPRRAGGRVRLPHRPVAAHQRDLLRPLSPSRRHRHGDARKTFGVPAQPGEPALRFHGGRVHHSGRGVRSRAIPGERPGRGGSRRGGGVVHPPLAAGAGVDQGAGGRSRGLRGGGRLAALVRLERAEHADGAGRRSRCRRAGPGSR